MREVRDDRKTPNILTSDASPRVHTDSDLQFLDWYRNRLRTKKNARSDLWQKDADARTRRH
jgi:hypothetical protein